MDNKKPKKPMPITVVVAVGKPLPKRGQRTETNKKAKKK